MSEAPAVICGTCGRDLSENSKFCKFCGTQNAFNCPRCDTNNDVQSLICSECGYRLDWVGRNSCCLLSATLSFLTALLINVLFRSRTPTIVILGLITLVLLVLSIDARTNFVTQLFEHERLKSKATKSA